MNLKETILDVLIMNETTRDDDGRLIYYTLIKLGHNCAELNIHNYLLGVRSKEIPPMETICRLGRLIKKQSPHLRGKEYILRQTKKQEKALSDMGY